MRLHSADPSAVQWWELGAVFMVANTGKRSVTLDLSRPAGSELVRELVARADVVIENYTPRVMENFGLGYDSIRELNRGAIVVRMPAFGLDGPWRDRPGLAQTMEQVSGLAWLTGYPDGPPVLPRGPCDPIAGTHAVLALLVALEMRERTGEGTLVEVPMVESVLNVAAEGVMEFSAEGHVPTRRGNRDPDAAPQGVYPCRGEDRWVAVAVTDDEQWARLVTLMGTPPWASDPGLRTPAGRRAAHDAIDEGVSAWSARHDAADVVERMVAAGIPAGSVVAGLEVADNPQLASRHFYEVLDHPVAGRRRHPGLPFRFASRRGGWLSRPAPTLGQHNHEILGDDLGLDRSRIGALEDELVVGTRPLVA